jgi:hypothetical protein
VRKLDKVEAPKTRLLAGHPFQGFADWCVIVACCLSVCYPAMLPGTPHRNDRSANNPTLRTHRENEQLDDPSL